MAMMWWNTKRFRVFNFVSSGPSISFLNSSYSEFGSSPISEGCLFMNHFEILVSRFRGCDKIVEPEVSVSTRRTSVSSFWRYLLISSVAAKAGGGIFLVRRPCLVRGGYFCVNLVI